MVIVSPIFPVGLFNRLQVSGSLLVIDLRDEAEFVAGHITGSINLNSSVLLCDPFDFSIINSRINSEEAFPRAGHLELFAHRGMVELVVCSSAKQSALVDTLQRFLCEEKRVWMFRVLLEGGLPSFMQLYPFLCATVLPDQPASEIGLLSRSPCAYPNEILDKFLWLGSQVQATCRTVLQHLHITHIINVTTDAPNAFEGDSELAERPVGGITYFRVSVEDSHDTDIKSHFQQTSDFIASACEQPNARVLVHCRHGVSRSASVVLAYLIASPRYRHVFAVFLFCSNIAFL